MSNSLARIKWLLECITDDIDKCTEWEQGFLRNVEEQFRRNNSLSDNQFNKLEKIYEERCQ